MEQIAEQITKDLITELPDQPKFYTPKELLSAGIPYFVVETLRDTVSSTIETGMKLPDSDWIQTDAEEVKAAWKSFVGLTKQHVKIPSSKLPQLLENAVEQCLKLLVQPRQSVPEFIYKTPTEIDFETAKKRVFSLEVSQQLGLALIRYMEKKGKDLLTFEEAREIIKKIDQKVIENYHPLNWAQVLKPVFELAGPDVDSYLLRKFFEDKGKRKIARKFELLDKKVNETEFIEILSSAEMLDIEGYEDDQQHLFSRVSEVDIPPEKEKAAKPEVDEERETEEEPGIEETDAVEEASDPDVESRIAPETSAGRIDTETETVPETEEEPEAEERGKAEDFSAEDEIEPEISTEGETALEEEQDDVQENIADFFSGMKKTQDSEDLASRENEDVEISLIEKSDDPDGEEEQIPLLNKFMFDEGETEENTGEEIEDPEEDPSSIYEEMNLVRESENKEKQAQEIFGEDEIEEDTDEKKSLEDMSEELSYQIGNEETSDLKEDEEDFKIENEDENGASEDEKGEDLPMWRSFLERDDLETESGYEYEEEVPENEYEEDDDLEGEIEDEEGFIEEPIYDLTTSEPDPEEKIEEVSKWLNDEKERFIAEIFGDSEIAYEQAIVELMDFDDWKNASRYLEREVFARNRVEVYDEAAVDFTDRLHGYFMQNKS